MGRGLSKMEWFVNCHDNFEMRGFGQFQYMMNTCTKAESHRQTGESCLACEVQHPSQRVTQLVLLGPLTTASAGRVQLQFNYEVESHSCSPSLNLSD